MNPTESSNPSEQPVKPDGPDGSQSAQNAPNPKPDDLPPSNLPSGDNFESVPVVSEKQPDNFESVPVVTEKQPDNFDSVPVVSEKQPEVPPAPEQPPPIAASSTKQDPIPISGSGTAVTPPEATNPYVVAAPVKESSKKNTMETVRVLFSRWAKKAADTTKKGQEYAGDVWQHLKTGPSITDAAVGRIAQGTKVLAEGGYEKIFRATFQTNPEERLLKSYVCYLSTSAGPVIGLLYMSTEKLAFCSDNPLPYKVGEQKKWSYYKVVIPLLQLKTVRPSKSKTNPAEKYIQIISVDNHEFWFMGFVYYDSAVKNLEGALQAHDYPLCIGSSDC
ncbi:hypothetical protein L2E82_22845 [Cichorium intybus]|uniref:Uncharacterized protein n=1 Tax=Cichorium intybus TaxID=13427 RepID=A0ACB9DYJ0_CICIN|nr:hypothetical protein L2E82_22845 [Cichorium intybus]